MAIYTIKQGPLIGLESYLFKTPKSVDKVPQNQFRHIVLNEESIVGHWVGEAPIRKWFYEHCKPESEGSTILSVTKENLKELVDTCKLVLDDLITCEIEIIETSYEWIDGKVYPDEKVIYKSKVAEELLPAKMYDYGYVLEVHYTFNLLGKILEEFDFDNEELFLQSLQSRSKL